MLRAKGGLHVVDRSQDRFCLLFVVGVPYEVSPGGASVEGMEVRSAERHSQAAFMHTRQPS
jgi:hypothetical protein